VNQVQAMGIKQVLSAPRSPWLRAYIERLIGTIRRECLDHLIVFNERSLYRHLQGFLDYAPTCRWRKTVQSHDRSNRRSRVGSSPVVGELHHRYERRAA
jgi:putative transposase